MPVADLPMIQGIDAPAEVRSQDTAAAAPPAAGRSRLPDLPFISGSDAASGGGYLIQQAANMPDEALVAPTADSNADQTLNLRKQQRETLRQVVQQAGGPEAAAQNPTLTSIAYNLLTGNQQQGENLNQLMVRRAKEEGASGAFFNNVGQYGAQMLTPFLQSGAAIANMAGSKGAGDFLTAQGLSQQQNALEAGAHPLAGGAGAGTGVLLDMIGGPGNLLGKGASKLTEPALTAVIGPAEKSAFRAMFSGTPAEQILTRNLPDNAIRGAVNFGAIQAAPYLLTGDVEKAKEEFRKGAMMGALFHSINQESGGQTERPALEGQKQPTAQPLQAAPAPTPAAVPAAAPAEVVPAGNASLMTGPSEFGGYPEQQPSAAPEPTLQEAVAERTRLADQAQQLAGQTSGLRPGAVQSPGGTLEVGEPATGEPSMTAPTEAAAVAHDIISPEEAQAAREKVAKTGVIDSRKGDQNAQTVRSDQGPNGQGGTPAQGRQEPRGADLQQHAQDAPQSAEAEQQGRKIAASLGVMFNGVQEGAEPGENFLMFTDPQTKSTMMIAPGEDAAAKLDAMREKFAAKAQKAPAAANAFDAGMAGKSPAPDSATPTGGGSKYGRSGRGQQEESTAAAKRTEGQIKTEYSRRAIQQKLLDWFESTGEPDHNTPIHYADADGNQITLDHPVLPPDAIKRLEGPTRARAGKYVDEDEWSNITRHMNAEQISGLEDEMLRRVTDTKADRTDRAVDMAKAQGDPRVKFLASYYENAPPFGEQVPKQWLNAGKLTEDDIGKSFEVHGEKFTVDTDAHGNLVLRDHIVIDHPEELGKIPIDKGSLKEASEAEIGNEPFNPDEAPAKTTGTQGSLLGERYEGSSIGSKTAGMFGDVSQGPASTLEEAAPQGALEKKFAGTKSGDLLKAPAADKTKGELDVGEKFPFPGSKAKDKFPVVTDVRMTADGQRQYQVRFSEKNDAQWMPAAKRIPDAELNQPPKASDVVDPENKSGFGQGSIGAAEDAAALARSQARQALGTKQSLLEHAAESIKNTAITPMKWLRNFRERFNFLSDQYGKAGTQLAKPLGEYIAARQSATYAGNTETSRVFRGLSEEQRSEFVSLGLDGRRQIENMGLADALAKLMAPEPKGARNRLAVKSTMQAKIADAVAKALDHPQSYDPATLGAELAGNLAKVHPDMVTRWADVAAVNPAFAPEGMAAGEMRRAIELMKLDPEARKRILDQKPVQEAIDRWKTGVEPTLFDIRARNKMPVDPNWDKVPLALNFVRAPSDRAFTPSPGIREHNPFTFNGEGNEKQTDPNTYLSRIISDHLGADREKSLLNALRDSSLVVPEKQAYIADAGPNRGKTVALIQGKETPVRKYDINRNVAQPDEKYLPANLVDELDTLNKVDRPDNSTSLGGWIIGMGLKGRAAFHAMSALMNTAAELGGKGQARWENIVPWLGSRVGTAVRGIRDASTHVGELHQMLLNDLGASGSRGFGSAHNERTFGDIKRGFQSGRETLGQATKEASLKTFGIEHDALFAPKVGAENVMRGQLLDSFLQTRIGDTYNTIKESVRSGKTTPLEATEKIRAMVPAADYQNAQRFVNDTLGWMDHGVRGQAMNRLQPMLSFIGVESSSIPGSIRRLMTANVDVAGVTKLLKAGDVKGAGVKAAQGIMTGPVGLFALANLVNLGINGRLMQDNDKGHKNDVHLGGGWYLNLDTPLSRAVRLTGITDWLNGNSPTGKTYAEHVAGRWANEMQAVLNPAYESLAKALEALSAAKVQFSPATGRPYAPKISDALPVPYLTNTARAIGDKKKSVGKAVVQDVVGNTTGVTVTPTK